MLSLYIHLPWCVRKCPYCDFNSFTAGDQPPKKRYLACLVDDLRRQSQRAAGRRVDTVFLGGGTPSFFTPREIGEILDAVHRHYDLVANPEITMEANPSTVESGDPAGYLAAGVNRLSIGAQSFDAERLRVLGRLHSVEDIARAYDDARAAGFDNINVDVMYALPGQGVDAAMADLDAAFRLGPEHISWYQLTLEPNTVFYTRPPRDLPDEDRTWAIQEAGQRRLARAGYEQYEVSAYARPGHACRHNLNYWRFGDYLAFGAGAHGKWTAGDDVLRYQNPANPESYMGSVERGQPAELKPVAAEDRVFEFALMALRLTDGFSETVFEQSSRLPRQRLVSRLDEAQKKGLIERADCEHWRPTSLGRRFLNDLQAGFLPDA